MLGDLYRPQFHYSAPIGWLNDPCGPSYFNGSYHLFYQSNPNSLEWKAPIQWGHAVSNDLVHWKTLDPAIQSSEEYDNLSIFTGSLVLKDQAPAVFYTGVTKLPIHWTLPYNMGSETVAIAKGMWIDGQWKFVKDVKNPVIPKPVLPLPFWKDKEPTGFRDPFVFQNQEIDQILGLRQNWYMILGSGFKSAEGTGGGYLPLYTSKDLETWNLAQDQPLFMLDNTTILKDFDFSGPFGSNWEVPHLFTYGFDTFLFFGVERPPIQGNRFSAWMVGKITDQYDENGKSFASFFPRNAGVLDHGSYYAANGFWDSSHQRFIQFGWNDEDRKLNYSLFENEILWSGVMGIPRELSSWHSNDNIPFLRNRPAPDMLRNLHLMLNFEMIETNRLQFNEGAETVNGTLRFISFLSQKISSRVLHIYANLSLVDLDTDKDSRFGFSLLRSENKDQVIVEYNHLEGMISIIRCDISKNSEFQDFVNMAQVSGSFPYIREKKEKYLSIDILLDNSILEVFANERFAISTRVYPSRNTASKIAFVTNVNPSILYKNLHINEIKVWYDATS